MELPKTLIETIIDKLRCPWCEHGIQVEERNCIAGYIQYKCTHCGYVESYKDKSGRATLEVMRR